MVPRSPSWISTRLRAQNAAAELGGSEHRGFACNVVEPDGLQGGSPARARGVRPGRHPDQQCRHHPAGEDHGHHARGLAPHHGREPGRGSLPQPGLHPAHARAQAGLDRLHVLGLRAARRRHLRRPALLGRQGGRAGSRQGHGARIRAGRHPGELRDARPDPDRHHRRQAHRRDAAGIFSRASRSTGSATPTTWPASTCSSLPTSPPTSRVR